MTAINSIFPDRLLRARAALPCDGLLSRLAIFSRWVSPDVRCGYWKEQSRSRCSYSWSRDISESENAVICIRS